MSRNISIIKLQFYHLFLIIQGVHGVQGVQGVHGVQGAQKAHRVDVVHVSLDA